MMLIKRRILELVSEQYERKSEHNSSEIFADSVINYCEKLLNTRESSVLCDPQFGLPLLPTEPQQLPSYEKKVVASLSNYEPRIAQLSAENIDTNDQKIAMRLRMLIQLHPHQHFQEKKLQIDTYCNFYADGTVSFDDTRRLSYV